MLGQLFKQRVTMFVAKGVIVSIKCQAGENIAKGSADPDIAYLNESSYYKRANFEAVHIMPLPLNSCNLF